MTYNNIVLTKDNGRGFPYDPELELFFWGCTDKELDPARDQLLGYQGVGLKVVLFSSNRFEVVTVHKKKKWGLLIRDAYLYESKDNISPLIRKFKRTSEPSGSTVSISFPDNEVQRFINEIFELYKGKIGDNLGSTAVEKFLIALEHYFRTYTYAGNLDRLLNLPDAPKKSVITMSIKWSQIPNGFPGELKEIFRNSTPPLHIEFENKHWDIEEILNRVKPPYRGRCPSPISFPIPPNGYSGRHGPRYVYVNKFTDVPSYQSLITNMRMRNPANIPYYQRYLFPRLRGIYIVVGSRPILSEYLFADIERQQFICAQSGVPTEHDIKEPTHVGELGYLPNLYFAVSTNARLNYGKRQVTDPWLRGYLNKYFDDAFRLTLRDLAQAFVGKIRVFPQTQGQSTTITSLVNITTLPGIAKVPIDENMLIAIFYTLVGMGTIQGINTYALSSMDPYDGKGVIKTGGAFTTPASDAHLQNMEFKLSLGELIEELHRGYKVPTDIKLIVVWEDDYSNLPLSRQLPDYGVINAQVSDLPEVSKKLSCRHIPYEIPIIVVKETIFQKFGRL